MLSLKTRSLFKREFPEGIPTVHLDQGQLQELQGCIEGILADVSTVLERRGLRYCLCFGSLLGAIRHQGFIPWDDDIDIVMPRDDLESFIEVFDSELGEKYDLVTPQRSSGCRAPFTKVMLKGSSLVDRNSLHGGPCGIYIDIFGLEYVPKNAVLCQMFRLGSQLRWLACSCRWFYEDQTLYLKIVKGDKEAVRAVRVKAAFGALLSFWTLDQWIKHTDAYFAKYRYSDSDSFATPAFWNGTLASRDLYFPARKAVFGKSIFRIPRDPAAILTSLYGSDYMTPPPEAERESHDFFQVQLPGWERPIGLSQANLNEIRTLSENSGHFK